MGDPGPALPIGKQPGCPPRWTKRQLIEGIRWRRQAGTPWRDVPPVYGSWRPVYGLFRKGGCADGTTGRVTASRRITPRSDRGMG
ncbi:MAG TPA: transposase [Amycolatopsis sp.]|nr:transposase [Amycolatopsis sp.]